MTVYAWPSAWGVSRFELRIVPNLRTFVGPYTPTTQVIDLLGERWAVRVDLPPTINPIQGAAQEAFFDRLKGSAHQVALWHLRFPAPQGTMRDDTTARTWLNNASNAATWANSEGESAAWNQGPPALLQAVAQMANTASVLTRPGRTVRAGDMLGIAGQLVRVMADATANGSGVMSIEFQPRARAAWTAYTPVVWDKPTANFMLRAEGVPVPWTKAAAESTTFEAIEAL